MPKHKTPEQWQLLIKSHAQSKLSVAEFCQQHELNNKTFYNQRTKLRAQQALFCTTNSGHFS
ncbi:hypothetical protein PSECIP111854_04113 [Pseudoalteromonas sp. CIP111854]|uniref:Transposase n=1 Tax=Pseudoalteromonas holothuriae TaxID=2963714 RepID=A0A9W4VWB9_9GAMM|nr:transposase [Pseudoalteromonas sp. CIP111854]CAH9067466.1 hypothetical protein PSECIP111854_04113 [Pseudoalteromonas sp. CIP111854]